MIFGAVLGAVADGPVYRFIFTTHKPTAFTDRVEYLRVYPPSEPIQVLGDSNVERAGDLTGILGPEVANLGVSGARSVDLLIWDDVFGTPALTRFLLIGTNDIARGEEPSDAAETIQQLIDRLIATAPLAVLSPPPARGRYAVLNGKLLELSIALAAVCRDYCEYIDLWPDLAVNGEMSPAYTSDGLHLNAAGYAVLADAIRKSRTWSSARSEMQSEP